MSVAPYQAELDFALRAARLAGEITLKHFQTNLEIETKSDGSPVTVADKECEKFLRGLVVEEFPDDGILGEEFGLERGEAARRWTIDPIDGTVSFVHGVPLYGVLIGLLRDGEAVVGVSHFPALAETLSAASGTGCNWNGTVARVSNTSELSEATILMTDSVALASEIGEAKRSELERRAFRIRTWGDAYGHALVASGRADAMIDVGLKVWDATPLLVILDEAGGRLTDWSGQMDAKQGNALATNRAMAKILPHFLSNDL